MSINKVLELAAGVLVSILIITWAISMYFKTTPMQKSAASSTDTITQSLTTRSFSAYDGTTVSGSDVISAINTRSSNEVHVQVKTSDGTTVTYKSASYNLTDLNSAGYIEPNANFSATISKTSNGTVNLISFVEQ